jgi:hypothetical protein
MPDGGISSSRVKLVSWRNGLLAHNTTQKVTYAFNLLCIRSLLNLPTFTAEAGVLTSRKNAAPLGHLSSISRDPHPDSSATTGLGCMLADRALNGAQDPTSNRRTALLLL